MNCFRALFLLFLFFVSGQAKAYLTCNGAETGFVEDAGYYENKAPGYEIRIEDGKVILQDGSVTVFEGVVIDRRRGSYSGPKRTYYEVDDNNVENLYAETRIDNGFLQVFFDVYINDKRETLRFPDCYSSY